MLKLTQNIGEYQYKSATFLKAELVKRGISYTTLSQRLETIGISRSPVAIRQGLHRGSLSMAFLFQCMAVLGTKEPNLVASLKYHLKRKGLTYRDLSLRLKKIGVNKSPVTIATTLSRGKLTIAFLNACATVLNVKRQAFDSLILDF